MVDEAAMSNAILRSPYQHCTLYVVQVGVLSEQAWTAAQASLDCALTALDGVVGARIQARIVNHILPALAVPARESQKTAQAGPPVQQPLQVLFRTLRILPRSLSLMLCEIQR